MGRSWGPKLALMMMALASPVLAQPTANEPASQAAFRAVLLTYDERAQAETDFVRLRQLEAERAAELARVLGDGLKFEGWRLVLNGTETTPMGGIFVRFVDANANQPKAARPTFWNSGPGVIQRHVSISARSPLHHQVGALKRGATVVVSGNFFADDKGGPFYESAKISAQSVEVERARFRMPYFPIRLVEVAEPGGSPESDQMRAELGRDRRGDLDHPDAGFGE